MIDFKEYAQEHDFSSIYYPYAEKGPKYVRGLESRTILSVVFLAFGGLLKLGASFIRVAVTAQRDISDVSAPLKDDPTWVAGQQLGEFIDQHGGLINSITGGSLTNGFGNVGKILTRAMLSGIGNILIFLAIVLIICNIVMMFRYIRNVIKRNQNFERNVIRNDIAASRLRSQLLTSLSAKKLLREAKQVTKRKSDSKSEVSADALAKITELQALNKLEVQVNTRQKLTNPKMINTQWMIRVKSPESEIAFDNLQNRIKKLNETASRKVKNKVSFGSFFITEDSSEMIFQGETPDIWDPYYYGHKLEELKDSQKEKISYESSFSRSLLISKLDQIKAKTESASDWCSQTGVMLDRILITNKMNVTRAETYTSATKASFVYDLAFDSNLSNTISKFDETIDKMFKVKGSTVAIEKGQLIIVIPLPSDYHIPIDVPSMYEEVFG